MTEQPYESFKDEVLDELGSRIVTLRPTLVMITGDIPAALILGQLLYWDGHQKDKENGWIRKIAAELEEETCVTERQQERIRPLLSTLGVIEFKMMGIPAMPHYRIKGRKIKELIKAKKDADRPTVGGNLPHANGLTSDNLGSGDKFPPLGDTNRIEITTESTSVSPAVAETHTPIADSPTIASDAEFFGRVLENPAKPLTDKQAALIGRGSIAARKKKAGESEVETALNAMRNVSMRIGADAVGWTRPVVKQAVREALDRGEDATILAVKFEDWVFQKRENRPGSWSTINADWLKVIIDRPALVSAARSAASQRKTQASEEPVSAAFLAGPPPSPTKDPVGLARWIGGIAETRFGGNPWKAQEYYEEYCTKVLDAQDALTQRK